MKNQRVKITNEQEKLLDSLDLNRIQDPLESRSEFDEPMNP